MLDCGVYDGIHCLMEKEMAHNRAALSIDPSLSSAVLNCLHLLRHRRHRLGVCSIYY